MRGGGKGARAFQAGSGGCSAYAFRGFLIHMDGWHSRAAHWEGMKQTKTGVNLDVSGRTFAEQGGVASAQATLREARWLHEVLVEVKATNPEHRLERKLLAMGFRRKADGVGYIRAARSRSTVVLDCFGTLDVVIEKTNGVGATVSMKLDGTQEMIETVTIGDEFSATRTGDGTLAFVPLSGRDRAWMNVASVFTLDEVGIAAH